MLSTQKTLLESGPTQTVRPDSLLNQNKIPAIKSARHFISFIKMLKLTTCSHLGLKDTINFCVRHGLDHPGYKP